MSKITLSEGFSVVPEGTHVFKITDVKYKEAFGKLEIKMKTAKGQTHTERFSLLRGGRLRKRGGAERLLLLCKSRPRRLSGAGYRAGGAGRLFRGMHGRA